MKILIDTREQRPYKFDIDTVTGTLTTGDYSICGLENYISIERKTIDDLIGCLILSILAFITFLLICQRYF